MIYFSEVILRNVQTGGAMRERINRLAKGILDTELPRVAAAPVSIDDAVRPHATVKKEFYVGSLNGLNVKGLVYSSNARVKVPVNAFGGLQPYRLRGGYHVHARRCVHRGAF